MDLKPIGNLRALIAAAFVVCAGGKFTMAQVYQQTDLVSDIPGLAQNPPGAEADTQLLNPWDLSPVPRAQSLARCSKELPIDVKKPNSRSSC